MIPNAVQQLALNSRKYCTKGEHSQKTFTCSNSTIDTIEKTVKHVQR